MQATKGIVGELRPWHTVFAWSAVVSVGLVLLITGEASIGPPWPAHYLHDRVGAWQRWSGVARLLVPGLGVGALLAILRPLRRAAGTFGCVAAAALATATGAAVWLALPQVHDAWLGAVIVGAALAAPVMRERGIVSLLLVALPIAAGVVVARRSTLRSARAAEQLAALRGAALEQRRQPVCVALPEEFDRAFRRALVKSLLAPYAEPDIAAVVLPAGAEETGLLQAAGYPLLTFEQGVVRSSPGSVVETQPLAAPPTRLLEGRGPVVVVEPAVGRWHLRVVTPTAVVERDVEDPVHGVGLADDSLDRYLEAIADLPPGFAILVRVEGPSMPSGSPWVVLRP